MTQGSAKDFFISYNKADRAWAEWVAWKLEEAGYTTILQAWDFSAGSNFVIEMHNAARNARRTIALLSPDYLQAHFTQPEWAAAFVQDPTGEKGTLLPVRVHPCKLDGLLASISYIDLVDLDEVAAQTTLRAKVTATRAKPSQPPGFPGKAAPTIYFPGKKAEVWNIPYPRNPFFTGRAGLLENLRARLTATKSTALTQAISGLGGIGKTQIAIEYAYRYEYTYRYVLWVNAATSEEILNDFVALAALLKAPGYDPQDQRTAVPALKQRLAQQEDWLLILDNADDLPMVKDFLPARGNGHILLTTRARATGALAQPVEVDKMEGSEGILLLLRRAGLIASDGQMEQATEEARGAAAAIVTALDGLPLALDQAGGYIEETGCTLPDYLHLYQNHRKELLNWKSQLSPDYPATVATTWSLAFQRIEQANPAAAALLQFCAFLAPDAIPEEMISKGSNELGDILGPAAADSFKLNAAIEMLRRYSLVRRNAETKMLTIHRLVQVVLQENMSLEMQRLWAERAINVVSSYSSNVSSSQEGYLFFEKCIPHAYACTELIDRYGLMKPEASELLMTCGDYSRIFTRYKEAERFYQRTLDILEKMYGNDNVAVPPVLYAKGKLYYMQDRYKEAGYAYQKALKIYTMIQGEENDIAEIHGALGQLYHRQGLYQQAEAYYNEALNRYIKLLKEEGLDVAIQLHQLATLYEELGKYQLAEEIIVRAISAISLRPSITTNQSDMPALLGIFVKRFQKRDEYEKIEAFYQETLNTYEKQFGSEHPDIATILHELAWHKRWQGAYEEAETLYQRALSIRESMLGTKHTSTAETLYYLAELKRQRGEDEAAEALLQRAFRIYSEVLGDKHISTGVALHELARLYEAQNKYEQSKQFYLRALDTYEVVQGHEHLYASR
jgi:tetratricopeptide (TPR) repeat protein